MEFVRDIRQLTKSDTAIAGGKGASLGEMMRAGFPVPPGFVVLIGAFERFVEEAGLVAEIDTALHSVSREEVHTVERAAETIRALIGRAEIPGDIAGEIREAFKKLGSKYVAVRSSATVEDGVEAAWAGQLESFLNVTEPQLLESVKKCWASLFLPRAIFYRIEKGLHTQKMSVAVVVQTMVQSESSGVAFSVHPVSRNASQVVVEAAFGLGEAVVGGHVAPDRYIVDKRPHRIVETLVRKQEQALYGRREGGTAWKRLSPRQRESQVLTDRAILELADLVMRIESHVGSPYDVEWARERGEFFIVQGRPISSLI